LHLQSFKLDEFVIVNNHQSYFSANVIETYEKIDETKVLVVKLHDHGLSHGKQSIPYGGSGIIKKGTLDKIESPCLIGDPGRYKYQIEAINENKVIIGIGSRVKYYPEN
jgi:hypothetical protein